MKKAVSFYMPDRVAAWNTRCKSGNPMRSKCVNDFIKYVKKQEVRRIGKSSNAKRPIDMAQFREAIKIFVSKKDFVNRYRFTTMMKFQYHLIARCDDMGNFLICDVHGHSNPRLSSFALETRVYWSKNVSEERDCPDQILLGCFDVNYCILLALGVYLETWLITGNGKECHLLFSDDVGEEDVRGDVVRLKNRYMSALTRSVFSNPLFISVCRDARESSHLGSHSIRKYPATFARQNGCSVDEIDCRGR